MDNINYIRDAILHKKIDPKLVELKSVLPPSVNIAKYIAGFANTEGGFIVLGVNNRLEIKGLHGDFHVNSIVERAIQMLNPKPADIEYQYLAISGRNVFAIRVGKSNTLIKIENQIFKREGSTTILSNPVTIEFTELGYTKVREISEYLKKLSTSTTSSKSKLIEHYQSILIIIDKFKHLLYPINPETPTTDKEGKILMRLLLSSITDNFEKYLSDLLYEIYLTEPRMLISEENTLSTKDVFNCSNIEELMYFIIRRKIATLQKGNINEFLNKNNQLKDLNALSSAQIKEIEKILEIRHLYTHRNGVIDEKFLRHYEGKYELGQEHQLSIKDFCAKIEYMGGMVDTIDKASIKKYKLNTF